MTRFKKKQNKEVIPQKIYTKEEIQAELKLQEKFMEKKKWTVRSWMKWFQSKGAIKVYNMDHHDFGVILPNFTEMRNFEDQIARYQRKEDAIDKVKVEELEKLAEGMKIS